MFFDISIVRDKWNKEHKKRFNKKFEKVKHDCAIPENEHIGVLTVMNKYRNDQTPWRVLPDHVRLLWVLCS